ncbi:MAG: DNA translocase FtsK 4TM domain-containing protein [Acidimicrobiales bacterium]
MATTRRKSTTNRRRSTSSTRSSSGRRAASTKRPARSAKAKARSRTNKQPSAAALALAERERDIAALVLFALAAISSLAILADRAGPVGRVLRDGIGFGDGVFRYVVPLVFVWVGLSLLRTNRTARSVRVGVGLAVMLLSGLAIAHLARGPGAFDAPADELRRGGGVIGAAIAEPLVRLVATPGAWLVAALVGFFGLLVLLDMSLRTVVEVVGDWSLRFFDGSVALLKRLIEPAPVVDADADRSAAGPGPGFENAGPEVIDVTDISPADDESDEGPAVDEPAPTKLPKVKLPEAPVEAQQLAIEMVPTQAPGPWTLPSPSLLVRSGAQTVDERAVHAAGRALEQALASHGVETKVVGMTVGPTVTRFELQLAPGVKVSRVTSLNKDIAYAMATPDVRILAPIPGRSAIGIEVPNDARHLVSVGDILASRVAADAKHPLEVALGQDIAGRPVMANLATMPHVLIAGATGAGKSSCINSILTSLLMRATPEQVRLILVDPKRVEMGQYDRLPHLLTQVVTNPKKAANALAWAVKEMERRYDLLSECGFRDITGYNEAYDAGSLIAAPGDDRVYDRIPFIVVVVDELNDLMMVAARDVEESITRLAQMARAVGIHLVIATQRPSVNVITGVIKANIPSRMAFAVSSLADSRVILDQPGAERLIGKGDMLLLTANSSVAQRIQGCWVTEAEVAKVVASWKRQAPDVRYIEGVEGEESEAAAGFLPGGTTGDEGDDDLLLQAMRLVVESQLGSTSMLQRKLKVGFARAGRLMDLLEQRGVVGPSIGSKARDVLMTPEELAAVLPAESV